MQINKRISLILSFSILAFSGCSQKNDVILKHTPDEKVQYLKSNNINSDLGFFEKDDEKFYRKYSEKLQKNQKIQLTNKEPTYNSTLIPSMYINIDSFEELNAVLNEVSTIYKIIFDEESRIFLTQTIKKESIIDMSKRNFTFDELMLKIAYKYNIYFTRVNNTYTFKLYKDIIFNIPTNLRFDNKNLKKEYEDYTFVIINKIKSFMENKKENALVYDDLTGNLYIRDRVENIKRIEKYISELRKLEDIYFNAQVTLINYKSKRKFINWNVLNNNLLELNINAQNSFNKKNSETLEDFLHDENKIVIEDKYTFKKGDLIKDKVLSYLNETGDATIIEDTMLSSFNNKNMQYFINKEETFVGEYNIKNKKDFFIEKSNYKLKDVDSYFNLSLMPSYNKSSDRVDLNLELDLKEFKAMKEFYINDSVVKKPLFVEKNIKNMYTIPRNSYILIGIHKDKDSTFKEKGFFSALFSNEEVEEYLILIKLNTKSNSGYVK